MNEKSYSRTSTLAAALCLGAACHAADPPATWKPVPPEALEWELRRGGLVVKIDLPHPEEGYYRGQRFEGSGIVSAVEYGGHKFFTRFHPGEAARHDNTAGTAEEFDIEEPQTYALAGVGEPFLKIGVGVLERVDKEKYGFWRKKPVVEAFPWKVEEREGALRFRQEGRLGEYAYSYEKVLTLEESGFLISRRLTNTGSQRLVTSHYGHNFIRIDDEPPGPGYEMEFPLPLPEDFGADFPDVKRTGERSFGFTAPLSKNGGILRADAQDLTPPVRFGVSRNGAAMTIEALHPLSHYALYIDKGALCPEPFTAIDLAPGETAEWDTRYTFGK